MLDITHEVTIEAPPAQVFGALTEQRGLAGWWLTQASAKPEAGFVNVFKFDDANRVEMRVTELVPNQKVAWKCLAADGTEDWVGTVLTFDLAAAGAGTLVRFNQSNWQEQSARFAMYAEHWGGFMQSLKAYCETGTGKPYGPPQ